MGQGDLARARFAIMFSQPERYAVNVFVEADELARRRALYPDIPESFLKRGVPLGAGGIFDAWVLKNVGVSRSEVYVDSLIRCSTDKYPKDKVRKKAEAFCRQYDRFQPTVNFVVIDPMSLQKDPAPLPMVNKGFEKVLDFGAAGEQVLMLAGGRSANMWMGAYASNANRMGHHYEFNTPAAISRREQRRLEGLAMSTEKKVRVKKLTVKGALELLLNEFTVPVDVEGGTKVTYGGPPLSWELLNTMKALCAPKVKKVKEATNVVA